jgi:hypothetical protein
VQKTRKLLGFDFGQKPAKRGVCSQVRILKGLEERKQNGLLKLGRGQVPWQQMKMLGSLRQKPSARTDQKASGPKGEPELHVFTGLFSVDWHAQLERGNRIGRGTSQLRYYRGYISLSIRK